MFLISPGLATSMVEMRIETEALAGTWPRRSEDDGDQAAEGEGHEGGGTNSHY